jgi:hypothetical protein
MMLTVVGYLLSTSTQITEVNSIILLLILITVAIMETTHLLLKNVNLSL